jgi:hypothetical protein
LTYRRHLFFPSHKRDSRYIDLCEAISVYPMERKFTSFTPCSWMIDTDTDSGKWEPGTIGHGLTMLTCKCQHVSRYPVCLVLVNGGKFKLSIRRQHSVDPPLVPKLELVHLALSVRRSRFNVCSTLQRQAWLSPRHRVIYRARPAIQLQGNNTQRSTNMHPFRMKSQEIGDYTIDAKQ